MVNTLVKHKKNKFKGIGCISKELKNSYRVNFGLDGVMTCRKDSLEVVDTSKCATVTFETYRTRIMNDKSEFNYCIIGNEVRHFVGIGWIIEKVVDENDLTKYPIAI